MESERYSSLISNFTYYLKAKPKQTQILSQLIWKLLYLYCKLLLCVSVSIVPLAGQFRLNVFILWIAGSSFQVPKILYASRTHSQLSQAVQELKNTVYRYFTTFSMNLWGKHVASLSLSDTCTVYLWLIITTTFNVFKAKSQYHWFSWTAVHQ